MSFEGRADLFIVARDAGRTLGFVTCRVTEGMPALELVAVRKNARGLGVGAALTRHAASELETLGHQTVEVVTRAETRGR